MNITEQRVVDQLSRDLDEIEKTTKMVFSYERITPEIVEHTQFGVTMKIILYHVESKSWFGNPYFDAALYGISQLDLIRPDDIVFDLGCNSGYQTVWLAKSSPAGHVHSFDPFPWNTAATRAQAALNGCANVTTHTVGLGRSNAVIKTHSYASRTFNASAGQDNLSIDIRIERPDRYLRLNPTFLKIDIEGAEHDLAHTGLMSHRSVERGYVEMHSTFIAEGGGDPALFLNRVMENGFDILDHHHKTVQSIEHVLETVYYFRRDARNLQTGWKARMSSAFSTLIGR